MLENTAPMHALCETITVWLKAPIIFNIDAKHINMCLHEVN